MVPQKNASLWLLALVIAGFLSVVSEAERSGYFENLGVSRDRIGHLGAEHYSVALAIYEGRGFSDPFRCDAGATAWVAPVFPYFISLLMRIFGTEPLTLGYVILAMQVLFCLIGIRLVLRIGSEIDVLVLSIICAIFSLLEYFGRLFQQTHDAWVVGTATLLIFFEWTRMSVVKVPAVRPVWWGAIGGLGALSSPAIPFVWLTLTTVAVIRIIRLNLILTNGSSTDVLSRSRQCLGPTMPFLLAGLVMLLVVAPWLARNYRVLGEFSFVKSNAGYELWQSQCVDADGVLDRASSFQHPWVDPLTASRHKALGEASFVEYHGHVARNSIVNEPLAYLKRVVNRCVAVFLAYRPVIDPFPGHPTIRFLVMAWFPIPFISAIFLVSRWRNLDEIAKSSILFYGTFCLPYILISYCDRYSAAIFWLKAIVVVLAVREARNVGQEAGSNQLASHAP